MTENPILTNPGDPEINLWLALSLLDTDPHVQIRKRLRDLYLVKPEGIEPYINLANELLELPPRDATNYLVGAVVTSTPSKDKLEDCATLKVLRSNLTLENFELLETFIERCWSSF